MKSLLTLVVLLASVAACEVEQDLSGADAQVAADASCGASQPGPLEYVSSDGTIEVIDILSCDAGFIELPGVPAPELALERCGCRSE